MKGLPWIVLALVTSCTGSDANVEGNYTIAVTNRDNGCNLANWMVGNQATGIQVTMLQEGSNVTATIEGLVGGYVELVLGARTFTGTIDGDELTLVLLGTRSQTSGDCTFTYNATLLGAAAGDTLTGRIEYTAATNGNPDCAALTGCVTYQDFNGTRPPQ